MRLFKFLPLMLLAGGYTTLVACGGDKPEDPGSTTGDDDDNAGDDDDDDTATTDYYGDDDDSVSGGDTAGYLIIGYYGYFDVAPGAASMTGTLGIYNWLNIPDLTLCEFGWEATGTPSSTAVPCTDGDGFACEFAFDVSIDLPLAESGGDCAWWYSTSAFSSTGTGSSDWLPMAYIENYYYNGTGYGPYTLLYFAGGSGTSAYAGWYGITPITIFDANTNVFYWNLPLAYYGYVPNGTYTSHFP